MKSKTIFKILIIIIITGVAVVIVLPKCDGPKADTFTIIRPQKKTIKTSITTTGTVNPQNRLAIVPPISGRIDKILVKEGSYVKTGQVLAIMSSEERAALIDAARSQGKKAVAYWKKTYKPISLIAPISGTVIVRSVEPGQTVTTSSEVLVISDRLIIKADVDETDIGKVRKGQTAVVSLDAYPDVIVNGTVSHISYESTVTNNVTIYEVKIRTAKVPQVYRSGMSANIEIIQDMKEDCLTLPREVIQQRRNKKYVLIKDPKRQVPYIKRKVRLGLSDAVDVEIVEGLTENDSVISLNQTDFVPSKNMNNEKNNPFMLKRKNKTKKRRPSR